MVSDNGEVGLSSIRRFHINRNSCRYASRLRTQHAAADRAPYANTGTASSAIARTITTPEGRSNTAEPSRSRSGALYSARMRTVLLLLIDGYRLLLSPFFGSQCRFYPTCSAYAREAIEVHGSFKGTWLAVRRILRCGPWHPGGVDKVPPKG